MDAAPARSFATCTAINAPPVGPGDLVTVAVAVMVVVTLAVVGCLFFGNSRVRLGAMAGGTCLSVLTTGLLLIMPRPPSRTQLAKALTPLDDPAAVGIAFSGGSLNGLQDAFCFMNELDEITGGAFGSAATNKVGVFTVSAGSLAYGAYVNVDLDFPRLRDAVNWTAEDVAAWPRAGTLSDGAVAFNQVPLFLAALPDFIDEVKKCLKGDGAACDAVRGHAADADATAADAAIINKARGSDATITAKEVSMLILSLLHCISKEALWHCIASTLGHIQGTDINTMRTGPKPWWIQFSEVDVYEGPYGGAGVRIPVPGMADHVALGALETWPGRAAHTLTSTRQFAPDGLRTRGGFGSLLVTPTADPQSVDLFAALAYSSDYLSMVSFLVDKQSEAKYGLAGETCPYAIVDDLAAGFQSADPEAKCKERAKIRASLTERSLLLGRWASPHRREQAGAMSTDGGTIDVSGLLSLLRTKVPHAVHFYESSVGLATQPDLSYLFGVDSGSDLCQSSQLAIGGKALQVFESTLWRQVYNQLTDPAGNGSAVLRNVRVLGNDHWGISPYLLKTLIVFGNGRVSAFESSLAEWPSIAAGLNIPVHAPPIKPILEKDPRGRARRALADADGQDGAANGAEDAAAAAPVDSDKEWSTWPSISGFGVTPMDATAKCLLAQWKVRARESELREILQPALSTS
mmetsp:Transcript_21512/g.53085  ORF Transcript_21512/g.53085 Transcript_21512/m.53085 type:complete len:690 (+) Transcript_21512:2-2071(+)